ncbi:MAG TPA: ABC transporter permease [Acidobacteriota bacterium]|nr:ABC transporter permease [Acidobacteriota bacterium]
MQSTGSKMRHVARKLARAPLFTIVAVTTLSVGIGANSAIFSVVNTVMLKPLPFKDPERLVGVWHKAKGLGFDEINQGPAFHFTYREENRVFEDVGMWGYASASVTGIAEPEQVAALSVTESMLPILGVQPILGRTFSAADDSPGSPETVILTYAYWQRKFGGDPGVIGRKLVIDGKPRDVIGVLPQSFRFLRANPLLYFPMQLNRSEVFVGNFSYQAIARLKPGITLEQANADVARMIPLALKKFPLPPGFTLKMLEEAHLGPNLRPLKQDVVGDVGKVLWVLLGTVGVVLLIACANVANLFLVRAESRQRELAIRAAMGASWGQIAQELLLESTTLGVIGGAFGLLLADAGLRLLVAKGPGSIPRLESISIDPTVLLFTLVVSLLAGILFGLLPVFKYARPELSSALKEGGRAQSEGKERHRARNGLVICQIALALVLLISSGLLIRTFQAMRNVQPGFQRPEEVLTLRVSIPKAEVAEEEMVVRTHEQIMHRIEQLPGITSVGLSSSITMDGIDSADPIFVEDFPPPEGQIPRIRRYKWISPNYFATMENAVLYGRDISWTDIYHKAPVVVITENLAREYWKDPAKAIGRRVRNTPKDPWREIVGVTGNIHDDGVNQKATPTVYWPMLISDFWDSKIFTRRAMSYAIRSQRAGSSSFLKEIQQAVWSVSPNLPLANVRLLTQILDDSMARTSFTLVMLGIAAGVALLLGLVGIYGVISYSVSQRTREIGIRIALGAQQSVVRSMFVRHGLLLTCVGVALGLAAAAVLTRLLATLLFGVRPVDPATYVAVSAVLGAVALLASYIPARRASSVDPVEALRWE